MSLGLGGKRERRPRCYNRLPSEGYKVLKNEGLLPDVKNAKKLLEFVHDIITTGSKRCGT